MPGNQKPRQRKHRGSQTGSITRPQRARPRNRQEAMAQARSRKGSGAKRAPVDRRELPPTWRGAIIRGLILAALLFPVAVLLLGEGVPQAIFLCLFTAAFYIPVGYYFEGFIHRRHMAKLQRERAEKPAASDRKKR